jgi:diguanylate cyclase (GGDEF)-like protein
MVQSVWTLGVEMTQSGLQEPPPAKLPGEIHSALVETLFGTAGSFLAGMLAGLLVPIIAYWKTHDSVFVACGMGVIAMSVVRLVVFRGWHGADRADRLANAALWEKRYALGGIGFMLSVGLTGALLFYRHADAITPIYGVVIVMGCAGALAARNAGRPLIVYSQVLAVLGPLVAVFIVEFNPWFWGLALLLVLNMASVKSTTTSLNGVIVQALMNGREARIQRGRFSSALDSMAHGLVMGDSAGEITVANHRLREFFGLSDEVVGLTVAGLAEQIAHAGRMPRDEQAAFTAAWESHIAKRDAGVFTQAVDGRIFDFRCEPMEMGGFVVVVEDVTTARLASREIERMAHFDMLTGLPNRLQFHNKLVTTMKAKPKAGSQIALLSVDLDQFKEVNDTRGHPTGDELLRLVAHRLRQCVHGADLVARFGGDEFQVLLHLPDDGRTVGVIAQRIIDTLSANYTIDGNIINIGASVGIAQSPRHAGDADELLRCADMALYRAKAEGRGIYRAFEPEMDTAMRRKREVEHHLREAILHEEMELHYQPVVDTRTGRIVAVEALARLRHPTEGLISPAEFIQVAEETGLIVRLGSWVLRRACRDAMAWPEHIRVAVNFSAKQFVMGHNVAADIRDAIKETGLAPERLEVEITESMIFEAKDALSQLREISASGVKLSLDDFGTGYSSLSYLRQFPVDKIKIDRSFAIDITSRESQAVIGSVSVLAQLLNVELVIEGIEERSQIDAIKPWNVRLVQGYVFSKPLPLAALLPLVNIPLPFAPPKVKKVA